MVEVVSLLGANLPKKSGNVIVVSETNGTQKIPTVTYLTIRPRSEMLKTTATNFSAMDIYMNYSDCQKGVATTSNILSSYLVTKNSSCRLVFNVMTQTDFIDIIPNRT